MSGLLAGKVWLSDLPAHLKPLAAALADCANDDGTDIFPGIEYTAWKLGDSDRSVQRGIKKLREMEVLVVESSAEGGRGKRTHYRMQSDKLPSRPSWKEEKKRRLKGDTVSPIENLKGDIQSTERVTNGVSSLLSDPSVDPSGVPPSQMPVPKPGTVYAGGHIRTSKPSPNKRHKDHVYCGDLFCVDLDKHQKFERRVKAAGEDLSKYDLLAWYKERDGELSSGEETTTDHPLLWLEKQFADGLRREAAAS